MLLRDAAFFGRWSAYSPSWRSARRGTRTERRDQAAGTDTDNIAERTLHRPVAAVRDAPQLLPPEPSARLREAARLLLPQYRMNIDLDTDVGQVHVEETVRWTNPGPGFDQVPCLPRGSEQQTRRKTLAIAERTVESLRLDPRNTIDKDGQRFHPRVRRVWRATSTGRISTRKRTRTCIFNCQKKCCRDSLLR